MSSEVVKMAVYDDRVVQQRPKYAVFKGGVSVNSQRFQAISKSTSQLTFQLTVPSENVFVDRSLDLSTRTNLALDFTVGAGVAVGTPISLFGRDMALSAFPLSTLISTLQATINDTTVSVNLNDVIREILRFTDLPDVRKQRTCPTYLDNYASYNDAANEINSPLNSYSESVSIDKVPNGAFYNVRYTDITGALLTPGGFYPNALVSGQNINVDANGVPIVTLNGAGPAIQTSYRVYVQFDTTEKLILSPFIFNDDMEFSTGLFGVQNIQVVANMINPSINGNNGRVIRTCTTSAGSSGAVLTAINYNTNATSGAIASASLDVQFITPPLSLSLPPRSVVPQIGACLSQ